MSEMGDVVIGEGVVLNGEIQNAQTVIINGSADTTVSAQQVIVGANGIMKGKITAQLVEVEGIIEGTIDSNTLSVRSTGSATGNISYNDVEIEIGGRILGELRNVAEASTSSSSRKKKKADAKAEEESAEG